MDHQKDYNVKVEKIWNLLDRIANNKNFFLVIKKKALEQIKTITLDHLSLNTKNQ